MTVIKLADYIAHVPLHDPSVLLDEEPYVVVNSDRDPALGIAIACLAAISWAFGVVVGVMLALELVR